jgi:hypothetical protein
MVGKSVPGNPATGRPCAGRARPTRPANDEEAAMRQAALVVLVMALVLGGLGCARTQANTSVDTIFMKYDADRNGIITKDEFVTHWSDKQKADTAWKKLDTAGNGFVSRTMANEIPLDVWSQVETQSEP